MLDVQVGAILVALKLEIEIYAIIRTVKGYLFGKGQHTMTQYIDASKGKSFTFFFRNNFLRIHDSIFVDEVFLSNCPILPVRNFVYQLIAFKS